MVFVFVFLRCGRVARAVPRDVDERREQVGPPSGRRTGSNHTKPQRRVIFLFKKFVTAPNRTIDFNTMLTS